MKKPKHSRTPRRKRMNRESRISSAIATSWVAGYQGKNLIKGYSKWFGVNLLTAVIELRKLGVQIDAAREDEIRATIAASSEARKRRREASVEKSFVDLYADSDYASATVNHSF